MEVDLSFEMETLCKIDSDKDSAILNEEKADIQVLGIRSLRNRSISESSSPFLHKTRNRKVKEEEKVKQKKH